MTTIQIQTGHYYRTRNGRTVGPMRRLIGPSAFPWGTPDSAPRRHTCMDDGRFYRVTPSAHDVVQDLGPDNPAQTRITPKPGMYMDAHGSPKSTIFMLISHVGGVRWNVMVVADNSLVEVPLNDKNYVRWSDETEWSRVKVPPFRKVQKLEIRSNCGVSAHIFATIEDGAVVSVALAGDNS